MPGPTKVSDVSMFPTPNVSTFSKIRDKTLAAELGANLGQQGTRMAKDGQLISESRDPKHVPIILRVVKEDPDAVARAGAAAS